MAGRRIRIGDHGLIGDTRSAALVASDGSIDWWCVPRFDDPPIFGRLVGGDEAGWFAIAPVAPGPVRQQYRPDTVTLTTTWTLDGGAVELADAMVAEVDGHFLPGTVLVRTIRVTGRPTLLRAVLAPRFGYGRRRARRIRRTSGALVFDGGDLALAVTSDGPALLPDAPVEFEVHPARPVTIVLSATRRSPLVIVPPAVARAQLARDEDRWRDWAGGIRISPQHDAATRSLLTLQLLTYSPSGAPVAAPTTSLPEQLGGARNWDYRYSWPRDACIGVGAFLAAGKPQEARSFLAWLLHASRLTRPDLPVLFTLDGRPGRRETTLEDWPGYAASRPVRIGNSAVDQHQLDGYGWVVDAAWLLTAAGHPLYGETWRTVAAFADQVALRWDQPDAGIWEKRSAPAHHVHSKLMAWLALDRAVRIAEVRGDRHHRRSARWRVARDALSADVHRQGYDPAQGAYTGVYGAAELDAAVLVLPVIGIEPVGSPRVVGTIDAIRTRLSAGGPLLVRYRAQTDDGLDGAEGAFLPCSFWLVRALALTGRVDEARALLDELIPLGGPLGLFPEEIDPATGQALGNYPQALTHAALVQAVLAVRHAELAGG